VLKHGTSQEILTAVRNGNLDAGFYNDPVEPGPEFEAIEVSRFNVCVVAAPGVVSESTRSDWRALSELLWIYPASSACCGRTAENLFRAKQFKPSRIVSVDRQDVTRTLVAGGLGVGLLHDDTALEAVRRGEVEILLQADTVVRVFFAYLSSRAKDPVLHAAASIIRSSSRD
jgi:DNA-binding transcriptional LysR family regulator